MDAVFRIEDFTIEPQLSRIRRAGKSSYVEHKAMEVLVFLAEHPEEVCPKEHIIQAVWAGTFVTDDVLTHAISELRKAFEDDAHDPRVIQTITRKGYRLMLPVSRELPQPDALEGGSRLDRTHRRRGFVWAAAIIGTATAAFVGIWIISLRQPEAPVSAPEASLVVLPFEAGAVDSADDYFSDGVTEDIITQLSKIEDLRVIARTSAMKYKRSGKSIREIARELGVGTILSGTVRRHASKVRISAELIDARTQRTLWAQSYDRPLRDIFEIQTDVSRQIAAALRSELWPAERLQTSRRRIDPEAYELYLRGRHSRSTSESEESLGKAVEYFRLALGRQPDYAEAWAGLAEAWFLMGGHRYLPEQRIRAKVTLIPRQGAKVHLFRKITKLFR